MIQIITTDFVKTSSGKPGWMDPVHFFLFLAVFFVVAACKNLDDAKPTPRTTFMHFYGGSGNFQGIAAEPTGDGYILVGDSLPTADFGIIVIKMDQFGNQVWRKNIPHGTASALKVVSDGYLIIGDSIKVNLRAAQVNDIFIRKSRLIKLDVNGTKNFDRSFGDTTTVNNRRIDYSGDAFVMEGTSLYTLNSVRSANKNVVSMVTGLDIGSNMDTLWSHSYSLIDRDFVNSKSFHVTVQGKLVWASSATKTTQNATFAYVEVPVVPKKADADNKNAYGINDNLYYSGKDIQPSGPGYGIIGTFQNITGGNKNICFLQTDISGFVIDGSIKFFDGVPSDPSDVNSITTDKDASSTDDEGSALTATSDGGYLLAGTSVTSTSRGNGGSDIFIIRVDPFGKVLWNQIIGGSGDESVSTVRQTSDGGFLICGTLNLNGLESMYVLKTDGNGNLQN